MNTISIEELRFRLKRKAYMRQLLLDAIVAVIGAVIIVLPFMLYYFNLL